VSVVSCSLEACASLAGDPRDGVANISPLPRQGDQLTLPVEAAWVQLMQTSVPGDQRAGCGQLSCLSSSCPNTPGSILPPKRMAL